MNLKKVTLTVVLSLGLTPTVMAKDPLTKSQIFANIAFIAVAAPTFLYLNGKALEAFRNLRKPYQKKALNNIKKFKTKETEKLVDDIFDKTVLLTISLLGSFALKDYLYTPYLKITASSLLGRE
jgi:hypothetical protein